VPDPVPTLIDDDEVAFRYANYDTPFWARANSSDGRWHERADGPTQYLCTSVEGAWAELIRAEGLRTEDEVQLVRMPMWVAQVRVATVADYSTFERAASAGFDPEALIDDDHARCRREGARLRAGGVGGVLSPSAALPGSVHLTLFGARVAATWGRPPVLASAIATTRIAVGAPPTGIVGRVRQVGEPHAAFAAYTRARP